MNPPPNPGANPDATLPNSIRLLPIEADQPLLPGVPTNCYLLFTEQGTFVVDPPSERDDAIEAIEAETAGELTAILITHTHPDHIGGVGRLAARHNAPVYAHPDALTYLPQTIDFRALEEGETVEGWEVLYTPGHRADSVTFLEPASGVAVVGDVVAGAGTVVISPPDGDLLDYLDTLRRLRDKVSPSLLAPGHGPLIDESTILLDHYINHRLAREQLVLAALSDTPQPLSQLLPRAYADTNPALYPLAERSLLAHLLKLQREGRAQETPQGWRLSEPGKWDV